jgi:two-component system, OmpR family, response regulator
MAKHLSRITYVEDEADIRAVAQIALEELGGFVVDMCQSGREALEKAGRFQPDVIILDVVMPDLDGIETFRALRADVRLAETPIIFMTAKVLSREVAKYRALGAAGVIPKPFNPLTLSEQVRAMWGESQSSGHPA